MIPSIPSIKGWKQKQLLKEILSYIESENQKGRYGLFTIRHGPEWDRYLDEDYNPLDDIEAAGDESPNAKTINELVKRVNLLSTKMCDKTLRQRIKEMGTIEDVVRFTSRDLQFELQMVGGA